jgi:hypothetical protein
MGSSTARVGVGHSVWHRSQTAVLVLMFVCLTAALASAQECDALSVAELDEISRLFGAQGKAIDAVNRLGGKVVYDKDAPLKRVVEVDLSGTKVSDPDLAGLKDRLKDLPEFTTLDLSETKVTDAGLIHLRGFAGLSRLRLAQTQITETGVAALVRDSPGVTVSRRPRDLRYFPDGAIGPEFGDFLADWYSEELYAMQEPSLWSLSRQDPKAVAYRFLWLPSFHRPMAVRVVVSGEGATLHAVQLDRRSAYGGGKPGARRSVKLSRDQWAELRRRVDEAKFGSLPPSMWHGIADGAAFVLEGVDGGKYHVVNANTNPKPDERYRRYKTLCEAMVKLSGLDVMDLWTKY